jgi:hypothetical protein
MLMGRKSAVGRPSLEAVMPHLRNGPMTSWIFSGVKGFLR